MTTLWSKILTLWHFSTVFSWWLCTGMVLKWKRECFQIWEKLKQSEDEDSPGSVLFRWPTIRCIGLFLWFGWITGAPDDVAAISVRAHELCAISMPRQWFQLLQKCELVSISNLTSQKLLVPIPHQGVKFRLRWKNDGSTFAVTPHKKVFQPTVKETFFPTQHHHHWHHGGGGESPRETIPKQNSSWNVEDQQFSPQIASDSEGKQKKIPKREINILRRNMRININDSVLCPEISEWKLLGLFVSAH